MRRVLAAGGGGSALVALLAKGWIAFALALSSIIVVTIAICWIVNDPDRPGRLALLLAAWRGKPSDRRARKPRGCADHERLPTPSTETDV